MAAQEAIVLENHMKLFTETKVGEAISLEFSTGCICIKPVKKSGSTTLATFWVRVIQSYFPSPEFTYKKTYSSTHASEVLGTVVDEYTIKIYLRTGLVTVEGKVVCEWFKVIFKKVIQHYDRSTYSSSTDYRRNQYVLDTRKELQQKERKVMFHDELRPDIVDERLALVSADIDIPEIQNRFDNGDEDINGRSTEMSMVLHEPPATDVICSVSLRDGNTHVYPMWKQLLNKWLSKSDCKVYVCSRNLDTKRLKDLAVMAYKNRLNTGIEAIYTNVVGLDGIKFSAAKDKLMKGHSADEQLFIEYRILNKTRLATTKHISCNFIAGVDRHGQVEVMLTSATFDDCGLERSQNLHTVTVSKLSVAQFQKDFLDRLATL